MNDEERRQQPDRRNDSIAASLARLEEIAQENRGNISSIRKITEDGFFALNGRVRVLEAWRIEHSVTAAERILDIEELQHGRRDDAQEAQRVSLSQRALWLGVLTLISTSLVTLIAALIAARVI